MSVKKMNAQELSKVYDEVSEDTGKFKAMIEKNAMDSDTLDWILGGYFDTDQRYPELNSVEDMSPEDFAKLYRKMSEGIKATPLKYETATKLLGMTPDQLSSMFERISGSVEKYPEVWDSMEKSQLLHPRNLVMLATAFKENTAEALGKIKGFSEEDK